MLNSVSKKLLIIFIFSVIVVPSSLCKANALYVDIDRDFNSNNSLTLLSEISHSKDIFTFNSARYPLIISHIKKITHSLPKDISVVSYQNMFTVDYVYNKNISENSKVLSLFNTKNDPINKYLKNKITYFSNIKLVKNNILKFTHLQRKANIKITLANTKILSSLVTWGNQINEVATSIDFKKYKNDFNEIILAFINYYGDATDEGNILVSYQGNDSRSNMFVNIFSNKGIFNNESELSIILPKIAKINLLPAYALSDVKDTKNNITNMYVLPEVVILPRLLALDLQITGMVNNFDLMKVKARNTLKNKVNVTTQVDQNIYKLITVTSVPGKDVAYVIKSENLNKSSTSTVVIPATIGLIALGNLDLNTKDTNIDDSQPSTGELMVDKNSYTIEHKTNSGRSLGIVAGTSTVTIGGTPFLPQGVSQIDVLDVTAPVMSIVGKTPIEVVVGSKYKELGALSVDNVDGKLTSKIITDGKVDTSIEGSYNINYSVKDKAGNSTMVTRVVHVVSR